MLVILWTDFLIWLLLAFLVVLFYKIRTRADFKTAMIQIMSSRIAVLSGLILSVYLLIALVDSLHFKNTNNNEIISVLDYILQPWSEVNETTFSAPLADKMFIKSNSVSPNGAVLMLNEKLKYINFNLTSYDALYFFIKSLALSIVLVFLASSIMRLIKNKKRLHEIYSNVFPKKTFFIGLFSIIFILSLLYSFYPHSHILGTDKVGRDVLYISIKSIRTGLIIGSLTTLFMAPFAVIFGTLAGYYGGKVDDLIQYLYITISSIPSVLLIAACILIVQAQLDSHANWFSSSIKQADIRLLLLCIILGLTSWSGLCRLIRAETLKIKSLDYVMAAKTMKVKTSVIIRKHIIPNLSHIIIINTAIDFSGLVLAEAVLSYIGVGVDPTTMSWGNMINAARNELAREPAIWWTVVAAFIPMFTFVLSLNLFADKLRDAFDSRIRLQ